MIEIIPAIDIIKGKCVRLTKGDYNICKTYDYSPVEIAKEFADNGLKWVHVVDLDGAKASNPMNLKVLEEIATKTNIKVEFGGGIKSKQALLDSYNAGAERVICGSLAITQPNVFTYWLNCYGGEKLIFGADMMDGKLAISGWRDYSNRDIDELLQEYIEEGLKRVIITDISKDGTLKGINIEYYQKYIDKYKRLKVVASGGVSSIDDIINLNKSSIPSVIVGKALYEGRITLEEINKFYNKEFNI